MMNSQIDITWSKNIVDALNSNGSIKKPINKIDLEYVNEGKTKYVYKIFQEKLEDLHSDFIAVVVPKNSNYNLKSEFNLLYKMNSLFENKYTPRPEFYIETETSKIIGMEYLENTFISDFLFNSKNMTRKLAYQEGLTIGKIYNKTEMFHTEPIDSNILINLDKNDVPQFKFLDVFHFEKGTLKELTQTYLQNYILFRPEILEETNLFKQGLINGLGNEYSLPPRYLID